MPTLQKTFSLQAPGKADARVRDKIRHDLKNYLRRERSKTLPDGMRCWRFECRLGETATTAETLPVGELGTALDRLAATGATQAYVEIKPVAALHPTNRLA